MILYVSILQHVIFRLLISSSECSDNEMDFRENWAFIQETVSMLTQLLTVLYILKVITGQLMGNEPYNNTLCMS